MGRRLKFVGFLVAAAFLLTGALCWIKYSLQSYLDRCFAHDTVLVLSMHIRDRVSEGEAPDQKAIETELQFLRNASIVHLWYDEAGRPVDPWGKPFVVEYLQQESDGAKVRCSSCGPDRTPGTQDDIVSRM